jgi:monoamine oxidase
MSETYDVAVIGAGVSGTTTAEAQVVACDGHDWDNYPHIGGAFQVDAPGDQRRIPRAMARPEGRIAFSGADLDEGIWQVSFESVLRAGHTAAT